MPVVVDANVLIAARFERDEDHERGLRLAKASDRGDLLTAYVLGDVLHEVCNYLWQKARPDVAPVSGPNATRPSSRPKGFHRGPHNDAT